MRDYSFQFTAKITKREFGRMFYTVVFAPKEIEQKVNLIKHPRLRIDGRIAGVPFSGAFQPNGGEWYLILSKSFLKQAGATMGDLVNVEFDIADQNKVDVPDDLMLALKQRPDALNIWQELTPGKRRGLSYRVASAKRIETREQRILAVIEEVMDTIE